MLSKERKTVPRRSYRVVSNRHDCTRGIGRHQRRHRRLIDRASQAQAALEVLLEVSNVVAEVVPFVPPWSVVRGHENPVKPLLARVMLFPSVPVLAAVTVTKFVEFAAVTPTALPENAVSNSAAASC